MKVFHSIIWFSCLYIWAKKWLTSCAACPRQIVLSSVLDSGQAGSSTAVASRQTTIDSIVDLVSVLSSPSEKETALAFSCCLTQTVCAYLTPCSAVRAKQENRFRVLFRLFFSHFLLHICSVTVPVSYFSGFSLGEKKKSLFSLFVNLQRDLDFTFELDFKGQLCEAAISHDYKMR